MALNIKTMDEQLEALALQGGSVALRFNPYLYDGRGAWICTATCEDGATFESVNPDGPRQALQECFDKAFA